MRSHKQHAFDIDHPHVLDKDKLNPWVLSVWLNLWMTFKGGSAGGRFNPMLTVSILDGQKPAAEGAYIVPVGADMRDGEVVVTSVDSS